VTRFLAHLVQYVDNTTHFVPNSGLSLSFALSGLSQRSNDPQLAEKAGELKKVLGGFDLLPSVRLLVCTPTKPKGR
jgi:hypothetical protein